MAITVLTNGDVKRRCPRTGIVVRLTPEGVYVRERGRKIEYGPISYGALLLQGARQYVTEQRKAKAAARALARAARRGRC